MNDLTLITPPPGLTGADYAMIEQAVMETARGRWFLLEYARRQRVAETQRLTDAVDRLEALIESQAAGKAVEPASDAVSAVAERLADIVWRMREAGVNDALCVEIERQIAIVRRLRAKEPPAQVKAPPAAAAPDTPEIGVPSALSEAQIAPEAAAPALDRRVSALSGLDELPLVAKLAMFC